MQNNLVESLRTCVRGLHASSSPKALASRMLGDIGGNVGMIFAMMIVPATAFVGIGVDYSRAFKLRSEMQQLVDNATLRAAKTYQDTGKGDDAVAEAKHWFRTAAVALEANGSKVALTETYVDPSGKVTLAAKGEVPTSFLKLAQINSIDVTANATASVPVEPLDVEMALVFDITGSMNQSGGINDGLTRLQAAKAAGLEMLNIMMPDGPRANKVRMSLIPFSQTVNIGEHIAAASGKPASEMRDDGSWQWQCVQWTGSGSNRTCVRHDYVWVANWRRYYRMNCTAERMQATTGNAYTDAAPQNASTHFPTFWTTNPSGVDSNCTPSARMIPLTEDKERLRSAISSMVAAGGTAAHIGIAWGWYSVSTNWTDFWPAESKPEPHDLTERIKSVVIMSDGDFNYAYTSRYNGRQGSVTATPCENGNTHCGNASSDIQARQLCDAIKAQGFEVFTIAVRVAVNSPAYNTLQYCASSPNHMFQQHFYYANTSREITRAFQDIATKVSRASGSGAASVMLSK